MHDDSTCYEYGRRASAYEGTPENRRQTSEQETVIEACDDREDATCSRKGSFSPIHYKAASQYYGDERPVVISHGNRDETNDGNMATTQSIHDPNAAPHRTLSHEKHGYAVATWTSKRSSPDETRPIVGHARSASDVDLPATLGSGGNLCR